MINRISKVAVLGGDHRTIYLCRALERAGVRVSVCGCSATLAATPDVICFTSPGEALAGADTVILPIPASRDGVTVNAPLAGTLIKVDEIASLTGRDAILYGGMINNIKDKFTNYGIECLDYAADELYAETNAGYTVEGALALAVENTPKAISDCEIALLGMGRIGKRLSGALKALGSQVTVFARDEKDIGYIRYLGMRAARYEEAQSILPGVDILFNTVPDTSAAEYLTMCDNLVIDLAGIGGVKSAGTIRALSLPSKYSPQSAGELICRTILAIEQKRGGAK